MQYAFPVSLKGVTRFPAKLRVVESRVANLVLLGHLLWLVRSELGEEYFESLSVVRHRRLWMGVSMRWVLLVGAEPGRVNFCDGFDESVRVLDSTGVVGGGPSTGEVDPLVLGNGRRLARDLVDGFLRQLCL